MIFNKNTNWCGIITIYLITDENLTNSDLNFLTAKLNLLET
ncbi:MAG: hypothetical protein JWR02_2491 [Mucilaginibacter sp.]|nr:hypothetical protein [Mucilaginibacter sp.]